MTGKPARTTCAYCSRPLTLSQMSHRAWTCGTACQGNLRELVGRIPPRIRVGDGTGWTVWARTEAEHAEREAT